MPPIHMIQPLRHFDTLRFSTELVYTVLILIFCLIIYIKTKEIYDLTKHKGIKYFRIAFLLLGVSYLSSFIFQLLALSNIAFEWFIKMRFIWPYALFITGYLSTLAILYLPYSLIWKKIKHKQFIAFANLIALLISVLSFIYGNPVIIGIFHIILIIVAITLISIKRTPKKTSFTRVLYILILGFWILHAFIMGPKRLIGFEIRILLQMASIVIFALILHKVHHFTK